MCSIQQEVFAYVQYATTGQASQARLLLHTAHTQMVILFFSSFATISHSEIWHTRQLSQYILHYFLISLSSPEKTGKVDIRKGNEGWHNWDI